MVIHQVHAADPNETKILVEANFLADVDNFILLDDAFYEVRRQFFLSD